MAEQFNGVWWSLTLPTGWTGEFEEECTTFHGSPSLGIIRISSARKGTGAATDEDLEEFAEGRLRGPAAQRISFSNFTGFSLEYIKEGTFWKEWWLKAGSLIVYITYNVEQSKLHGERDVMEQIIRSLASIAVV